MNIVVNSSTPLDVDTGIWQPNRSFRANSALEPGMPEVGADPLLNPSRLEVVPEAPLDNWLLIGHEQPFAHLNVGGPNDGKVTMHVIFTNHDTDPDVDTTINVFFWCPDTKVGPGEADVYAALPGTTVDLGRILEGAAGGFRALSTTGVVNTGLTTVAGDIGASAAAIVANTGWPPGTLTGTIYGTDSAGTVPEDAHTDLIAARLDIANRQGALPPLAAALGGLVLTPGLYDVAAVATIVGDLTLDALGDPNAVFIFRCASTLALAAAARIILAGGALPDNVFFSVTSASIGAGAIVRGNILASGAITSAGGAGTAVHGRLLAGATAGAITISAVTVIDGL